MQPVKFEERAAFHLLGIQRRLDPHKTDWSALWQNDYAPHIPEIEPRAEGNVCFGAYMGGGEDGLVDFVGGQPAGEDIDVPSGLILRKLPAATYAVFECTIADIGATWQAIYSSWLPASDCRWDESKACFEEFAPGCHEGTAPVRIFVPVVRQG